MEDNKSNEQKPTAAPTAGIKMPTVKKIKVPAKPITPPAPQSAQPAAAPKPSAPKPQPQIIQPDHSDAEPDLPPEEEEAPRAPTAADPASFNSPEANADSTPDGLRRKRRPSAAALEKEAAKKKAQEKIDHAKARARKVLTNRLYRLGILTVLLVVIAAGVWSSLPMIAENKLPAVFAENGMPFKKFTLKEIKIDSMELSNVSDQTGTLTVGTMKFGYSLMDLFSNSTVKTMELSNVTLNGRRTVDGFELGALGKLISSPMRAKSGSALTINSLKIANGNFILRSDLPPEKIINADGEEEEIDNTVTVRFSANGSMGKAGLNMNISTDSTSPTMKVKTQTQLNKTATSSHLRTEITEGDMLKDEKSVGSATGNLEISIDNGVLSKGLADLLLSSSSQKLKLKAEVLPKGETFDVALDLDRSFEDPKDAKGKFVGALTLKAKDLTVKGRPENFEGRLPVSLEAPTLTNGRMAIQDLKTSADVLFSCASSNCTVKLTKPMTFAFSALQAAGNFRQVKLFTPLELTINPDQNDPFLRSEGANLSFTLPLGGVSTQAYIADAVSGVQTAVAANGVKARVKYNVFTGAYSGEATFAQSALATKDIKMTGVQGIVSFTSGTLPDTRLRVARASFVKPDLMPDFSADLRFRPMSAVELGMDATVALQNGIVTATANGSYTLPTHEWNMYVVVPKFVLSDSGLSLDKVAPFMRQYLPPSISGGFAAKGRVTVKDGKVAGPVDVLIENVAAKTKVADIEALNGVVTLSSIYPLETPANQRLFIGTLNVGIPFQNALFNFRIAADRGVEVAGLRMKYADGQFKNIKPFTLPYAGGASKILMEGSGINLANVVGNLRSDALLVDGIMNSEWQLSYTGDKLALDQAVFTSKLPGTLHFNPSDKLRKKMNPQMLAFMKDVIVKKMKLTAKGQMDGAVKFNVSLTGHTPLEAEGVEQDVSFDFTSGFKNLLKQQGGLMEIPSDILLSLQDYAKK